MASSEVFNLKKEVERRRAEDRRLRRCRYLAAEYEGVRNQSVLKGKTDAEVFEVWRARLNRAIAQGVGRRQAMINRLDNPYLADEMLEWFYGLRGSKRSP